MDNRGFQEQTFRLKKVSPSNQTFKLKQVKPYKAPKWPSYLFYGSIILGVSSVVGLSLFESLLVLLVFSIYKQSRKRSRKLVEEGVPVVYNNTNTQQQAYFAEDEDYEEPNINKLRDNISKAGGIVNYINQK